MDTEQYLIQPKKGLESNICFQTICQKAPPYPEPSPLMCHQSVWNVQDIEICSTTSINF